MASPTPLTSLTSDSRWYCNSARTVSRSPATNRVASDRSRTDPTFPTRENRPRSGAGDIPQRNLRSPRLGVPCRRHLAELLSLRTETLLSSMCRGLGYSDYG